MKISKYIIIALSGIVMLTTCQDFLEDKVLDRDVLDNYLKKDTEAALFLYGGISHLRRVLRDGATYLSVYETVNDQTYFGRGSTNAGQRAMSKLDYDNNILVVQNVWQGLYECIAQMNILIDQLENGDLKNSVYTPRLLAQARYYRAFCYFDLVRLWGPVPVTKAYYSTAGIRPARNSVEEVYKVIVDDLTYGLEDNRLRNNGFNAAGGRLMPDTVKFKYPNDPEGSGENYVLPISRGAAQLLLAKVYLTRNAAGDHAEAEKLVDEMIENPLYQLLPNYGDLFAVNTKTVANRYREVLFEFEIHQDVQNNTVHRQIGINRMGANQGIKQSNKVPGAGTNAAVTVHLFNDIRGANASGYGYYFPTEYFLSWFDGMKDKRYFWLFQFGREEGGPFYQKGRDEQATHNDNGYCNNVLLRYADAFLIKAELRARANDAGGVKTAIDPILERAGLDPYNTTGKSREDMIADVLKERAKEFTVEAGNRTFDMRRTGFKAAMDEYEAWYIANVQNGRAFPHRGPRTNDNQIPGGGTAQVPAGILSRTVYTYINPAAQGNVNYVYKLPFEHNVPAFPFQSDDPIFYNRDIRVDADTGEEILANTHVSPWVPVLHPETGAKIKFVDLELHPRQDQRNGGDFFEMPVPFNVTYDASKWYSQKAEWHPIPSREMNENPNLDNNMNLHAWN